MAFFCGQSLLAEDWAAWAEAWRALDAEVLAPLALRVAKGEAVSITLCGERGWQRYRAASRSLWRQLLDRFKTVEPHAVLSVL